MLLEEAHDNEIIKPKKGQKQSLKQAFHNTRCLSLMLADPLSEADVQLQSMPDASPSKWHLAHTTWFFERFILAKYVPNYCDYHPAFKTLFNSYYNGIGEQYTRAQRGLISRPSLAEILAYRESVDQNMLTLLSADSPAPELRFLVELGIHHEQQHQELFLTDIKHALSFNPLFPAYRESMAYDVIQNFQAKRFSKKTRLNTIDWHEHPGGLIECGHVGEGFAYDNESPRHKVFLKPFKVASNLVTNEEYLAFIDAWAYLNPDYWLSDGWAWLQESKQEWPLYWRKHNDIYHHFTLHGDRPLDPRAPVTHINYYEASAYACWAGKRLPTEFEWEAIVQQQSQEKNEGLKNNGGQENNESQFLDLDYLHPRQSKDTFFGSVWQWTSSPYSAYPGFKPFSGTAGEYNGKFMSNQYVLRGGSCVTPQDTFVPVIAIFSTPTKRGNLPVFALQRIMNEHSDCSQTSTNIHRRTVRNTFFK